MAAYREEGVHSAILQPDMRVFWRKFFKHQQQVSWDLWWTSFPTKLREVLADADQCQKVEVLFQAANAQPKFQQAVNRCAQRGAVRVLCSALPACKQCQSERLPASPSDGQCYASYPAYCRLPIDNVSVHNIVQAFPENQGVLRSVEDLLVGLPAQDEPYYGREEAAAALVARFQGASAARAVCLVADGGMGKSSLAADAVWRLQSQGLLPGGFYFIDLRDAYNADMVLGRFCAALGAEQVGSKFGKPIFVSIFSDSLQQLLLGRRLRC